PSLPGNVNVGAFCPSKFAMHTSSNFDRSFAYHSVRALIKLAPARELSFPDQIASGKSTPNGVLHRSLWMLRHHGILQNGHPDRQLTRPWRLRTSIEGSVWHRAVALRATVNFAIKRASSANRQQTGIPDSIARIKILAEPHGLTNPIQTA